MPGPAPKHPSARTRRNSGGGLTTLPSAGRKGKTPPWPLGPNSSLQAELAVAEMMVEDAERALEEETDGRRRRTLTKALEKARITAMRLKIELDGSTAAESELWAELWTYPQAVQWERDRAHRSVAMYVRWQVRAENGHLEPAKEARMWADRLGLSSLAMQRLKLEVERADAAATEGARRRSTSGTTQGKPAKGKDAPEDPRAGLYLASSQ